MSWTLVQWSLVPEAQENTWVSFHCPLEPSKMLTFWVYRLIQIRYLLLEEAFLMLLIQYSFTWAG